MAEVTLIDFSSLNRLTLSTFTEGGPMFSNQDSRLDPVTKNNSTLQYPISVTSVVLISKGQPYPTSSDGGYTKFTRLKQLRHLIKYYQHIL